MSLKADIKALEELQESRGWAILRQKMQDSILQAALALAESPVMSEKEIDFRRGCMFAGKALMDLPEDTIQRLINELAIEENINPHLKSRSKDDTLQ